MPPELLNRRAEVARVLGVKVDALSKALRQMTDEERRAVFYKLEHDAPVDLSGTGLKPISQPTSFVTLAIPREDNLDKLAQKVATFGSAPVKKGHVPNESLAHVTEIGPGDPKDRLSDELFARYDELIKQPHVICEIEILSLQRGPEAAASRDRFDLDRSPAGFRRRHAGHAVRARGNPRHLPGGHSVYGQVVPDAGRGPQVVDENQLV